MVLYMDAEKIHVENTCLSCDFQQCGILKSVDSTSLCNLLLSLETPNAVQAVA